MPTRDNAFQIYDEVHDKFGVGKCILQWSHVQKSLRRGIVCIITGCIDGERIGAYQRARAQEHRWAAISDFLAAQVVERLTDGDYKLEAGKKSNYFGKIWNPSWLATATFCKTVTWWYVDLRVIKHSEWFGNTSCLKISRPYVDFREEMICGDNMTWCQRGWYCWGGLEKVKR